MVAVFNLWDCKQPSSKIYNVTMDSQTPTCCTLALSLFWRLSDVLVFTAMIHKSHCFKSIKALSLALHFSIFLSVSVIFSFLPFHSSSLWHFCNSSDYDWIFNYTFINNGCSVFYFCVYVCILNVSPGWDAGRRRWCWTIGTSSSSWSRCRSCGRWRMAAGPALERSSWAGPPSWCPLLTYWFYWFTADPHSRAVNTEKKLTLRCVLDKYKKKI